MDGLRNMEKNLLQFHKFSLPTFVMCVSTSNLHFAWLPWSAEVGESLMRKNFREPNERGGVFYKL